MGRNDNLISIVLTFLIIIILGITTYFCLDIFNIIEVPKQYSFTQFFAEEKVQQVEATEAIVNKDNIDEWINKEYIENIVINDVQTTQNIEYIDNRQEQNTRDAARYVVNRMYYSQLDIYGRMIYDKFNDNIDNLKSGTYVADFDTSFNDLLHEENGSEVLENAFQFAINAFLFDNPEVFYIEITKIYMSTEIISFGPLKIYKVKIGPLEGETYLSDFFVDEYDVNIAVQKIENIKQQIILQMSGNLDNHIKIVHDYLIKNTDYDDELESNSIYTVYGALVEKKAVCEGYAKAFKMILDELEIPCVIACGLARNSNRETENHAWNYVKIDDSWYAVDCTWDDPLIIGTGTISPDVYKRYLLKGSLDFFEDHFEDGKIVEGASFVYPTISKENYK